MFCYNDVYPMKFFTKRNKAVKKWRSRAMIIDVSKTRVTFSRSTDELVDLEADDDSMFSVDESSPTSTANVQKDQLFELW